MGAFEDYISGSFQGLARGVRELPENIANWARPAAQEGIKSYDGAITGNNLPYYGDDEISAAREYFDRQPRSNTSRLVDLIGNYMPGMAASRAAPVAATAGETVLGAGPVLKTAVDPMRAGKVRMVNPLSLEFREAMQNNTAEIGRMFPPNKPMPPIVTTIEDEVETILDGHNRTAVALERGASEMPAVTLSTKQYQSLIDAGFDDAEISYAALMRAGKRAAAAGIDKKFTGAGVARRGADAVTILKRTPFD